MFKWITNNFWIKLAALFLAIVTWFYVNEELSKERQSGKSYLTEKKQDAEVRR